MNVQSETHELIVGVHGFNLKLLLTKKFKTKIAFEEVFYQTVKCLLICLKTHIIHIFNYQNNVRSKFQNILAMHIQLLYIHSSRIMGNICIMITLYFV